MMNTTEQARPAAVAGQVDRPVRPHAISRGGLQSTVLEAYRALYGNTNFVTGNKLTAQRYMASNEGEWLCLRFNDFEALKRASDALTLLEQQARRMGD